jgi:hypothetical protein
MITEEEYAKTLKGYNIVGCAVRSKDGFVFVAQEDYTKWPGWNGEPPDDGDLHQRVVPFWRDDPVGQQWSMTQINAFEGICAAITLLPKPQLVVSGVRGFVYSVGSGDESLEKEAPSRGGVSKLKTIGEHVYLAGGRRTVLRREDKDRWLALGNSMPAGKFLSTNGFQDVDGFSETHLYAVGGEGDVWRGDGKAWTQCAFPTNARLNTVCCAPDGKVYISGIQGITFVGKDETWKLVAEPGLSILFKDMIWHEDRVWCTNDYGVWWIKDGQLKQADLPGSVGLCSGYLSARDGVLLLAGHRGAAFLESNRWQVIFHPHQFEQSP